MTARALLLAVVACSNGAPPSTPAVAPAAPATATPGTGAPASAPAGPIDAAPAAPLPATPSRVVEQSFHSDALGVAKDVVVYLPAGYDPEGTRRWPVFYYLHGLAGDETNWTKAGRLAEIADAVKLAAIVVMPDGDSSFYVDAVTPVDYDACIAEGRGLYASRQPRKKTCVRTPRYETYMTRDLIAWVDRTYKTIAARDGRGIAGLSMGGYGALMLAMRHPDLYGAAASHSGLVALLYAGPYPYEKGKVTLLEDPQELGTGIYSFGSWMRKIYGGDIARWRAHDPAFLVDKLAAGGPRLYLDCGTEDELLMQHGMQYLHDRLVAKGIEHEYYLGPGRHGFGFWSERLPKSLAFLTRSLATPR